MEIMCMEHQKVCTWCKAPFTTIRWQQQTCSRACQAQYYKHFGKSKAPISCANCGAQLQKKPYVTRFCNPSCSAQWRMQQTSVRTKVYTPETRTKIARGVSQWLQGDSETAKE